MPENHAEPGRIRRWRAPLVIGFTLVALLALTLTASSSDIAGAGSEAETIRILVMVPMSNIDDFELMAISSKFRPHEQIVIEFAGSSLGSATTHSNLSSPEIAATFDDVDVSLYSVFIVLGTCQTSNSMFVGGNPIGYTEHVARIMEEADAAGKIIAALSEGTATIESAGLKEGRSVTKTPVPANGNVLTLTVPGVESASTVILGQNQGHARAVMDQILIALGLMED